MPSRLCVECFSSFEQLDGFEDGGDEVAALAQAFNRMAADLDARAAQVAEADRARRLLPADREELPREVQQNIDMESYRIRQTSSGKIAPRRTGGRWANGIGLS